MYADYEEVEHFTEKFFAGIAVSSSHAITLSKRISVGLSEVMMLDLMMGPFDLGSVFK